jgi:hypothetical protein
LSRCDLDRLLGRGQRALEIALSPPVGGEHQQRTRVVGLGLGGPLRELVGLGLVAFGPVQPGQQIDQLDLVVGPLDALLEQGDRIVEAVPRVVEAAEERVGAHQVVLFGQLYRLAVRRLHLVVVLPILREEATECAVGPKPGLHLGTLAEQRLRGRAIALAAQEVGQQQQHREPIRCVLVRRSIRRLRLLGLLQPLVGLGLDDVGLRPRRIRRDDVLRALERLLELAGVDRQLGELEHRIVVGRIEPHRLAQLPERLLGLPRLQQGLGESEVRRPVVRIELEHVLVLDDRLVPLLFLGVGVTAGHVLIPLLLVGLAGRQGQQDQGHAQDSEELAVHRGSSCRSRTGGWDPGGFRSVPLRDLRTRSHR